MDTDLILELVGYLASLLVLISLLMSSVVKLRIINSIGAAIFTVYALLIQSYPTAVMNFALIIINVYFLVKVLRAKKLLSVTECDVNPAVTHFIEFYRGDILKFFPGFDFQVEEGERCWMVYADATPVGVMIGRATESGTIQVRLDYACPSHRDCSVGKHLYGYLKENGVLQLTAQDTVAEHNRYLQQMGFAKETDLYIKNL